MSNSTTICYAHQNIYVNRQQRLHQKRTTILWSLFWCTWYKREFQFLQCITAICRISQYRGKRSVFGKCLKLSILHSDTHRKSRKKRVTKVASQKARVCYLLATRPSHCSVKYHSFYCSRRQINSVQHGSYISRFMLGPALISKTITHHVAFMVHVAR